MSECFDVFITLHPSGPSSLICEMGLMKPSLHGGCEGPTGCY